MNRDGLVVVATIAVLVGLFYVISKSGNADCKRFEMREVEMIHQGKYDARDNGIRKHQYKVCAER